MSQQIIALVNRKGGVGKSKSCSHIAEVLRVAGHKVTGVDCDPEKNWMKLQAAGFLQYPVVEADAKTLKTVVEAAADGFVVIDTPPNDNEIILKACLIADEVIVPVGATGDDINRLQSTLAEVESIEQARQKPLASVLLTRWQANLLISREVLDAMEKRQTPVLDSKIRFLTVYKRFAAPEYLDEYRAVLEELEVINAQA